MTAGQPWFESVVLSDEEEGKVAELAEAVAAAVEVGAAARRHRHRSAVGNMGER